MDRVRMGVIGIGSMGSAHAMQIHKGRVEGMTLTAVCDTDPLRLEWAAEEFGKATFFYTDYHDLISSGKIDAVLIAPYASRDCEGGFAAGNPCADREAGRN